jgi:drug/metabolite transporter (DMT)-like permease
MMSTSYTRGMLFCLAATLSWGAMFPVMTSALTRVDPFTLTSLRYTTAAAAFLLLVAAREGRASLRLRGERAWLAWLLGSAGFGGFGFLVCLGQQLAGGNGALTASIMMATMPMLGILVNWVLRKVVPPRWSVAFMALSFCGVVTVITKGDLGSLLRAPGTYGAYLLIILGALCWVIYTVGASYFPHWSPYRYTAITTALGMTSVLTVNAILYASGLVALPTADALTFALPHLLYIAFGAGVLGVLCWNLGNSILTPLNGVLFMDVVPVTAFAISAAQGTVPTQLQLLGASLTASALIMNNVYMRHRLAAAARPSAALSQRLDGAPGRAQHVHHQLAHRGQGAVAACNEA